MTEVDSADFTKVESTESSPPLKTDPKEVSDAEAAEDTADKRILRAGDGKDPEYVRQRKVYTEQFQKSEGYDVDWDSFEYDFAAVKFEWGGEFDDVMSNKELMGLLIKTAIDEENEESGTELVFVKYVSANVMGVQGFLFYITFWAKDVSEPNPEPKLYQAKVRTFMDKIKAPITLSTAVPYLVGNPGIDIPPSKTQKIVRGKFIGILILSVMLIGGVCLAVYREMRLIEMKPLVDEVVDVENRVYMLGILREVTEDFRNRNVLWRGGFGSVYKGRLRNGT
ncbi:unnamed protein product [Microthlaspi erraticum]|uniref:Cystatin domain-containing protein n=1 Tax=Microthlaspi erraticum TaxID=1685480 RepID=A0A6D2KMK8_9BRAS|nr:unnamed protein product [Microthlaspi erraticum]